MCKCTEDNLVRSAWAENSVGFGGCGRWGWCGHTSCCWVLGRDRDRKHGLLTQGAHWLVGRWDGPRRVSTGLTAGGAGGTVSVATVLRRHSFGQGRSGLQLRWIRFDGWWGGVDTEGRLLDTGGRCDGWEAQDAFRRLKLSLKASLFLYATSWSSRYFYFPNGEARFLWFRTMLIRCSLSMEILNRDFPCWVNVELGCSQVVGMCPCGFWSCPETLKPSGILSFQSSWPLWEPEGSGQMVCQINAPYLIPQMPVYQEEENRGRQ